MRSASAWIDSLSICRGRSWPRLQDGQDVRLAHDEEGLVSERDLGAGVFAEEHPVPLLHLGRDDLPLVALATRADGDDLALLRLLLGGVGDDDPAALHFPFLQRAN